jgi:hypothetical protein
MHKTKNAKTPSDISFNFFLFQRQSSHFIVHKKCKKIDVSLINMVITYGPREKTILPLIAISI